MAVLMSARDLSRKLEGEVPVTLVSDASLEIRAGEFVAIIGPSGSGKSSLLYLLGLLDSPTTGRLFLREREVGALGEEELAQIRLAELGFVFQFHFLLPEFSALENVMLPMRRLGRLDEGEIRTRAAKLLSDLGLDGQQHKLPRQLSGGQSQRVAIARALANDPTLIFADEPTGNLDRAASENVESILRDAAHSATRAVVVVTHDQEFANRADRIISILDGKIQ